MSNFYVAGAAAMTSSRDDWETPQALFDELDTVHRFTLDPCSTHANAKCAKHYTRVEDGLAQSWEGETVFCNPPYGRDIGAWFRKCWEESRHAKIVLLIPARTDTAYFHDYAYRKQGVSIEFLRGRLKFELGGGAQRLCAIPLYAGDIRQEGTDERKRRSHLREMRRGDKRRHAPARQLLRPVGPQAEPREQAQAHRLRHVRPLLLRAVRVAAVRAAKRHGGAMSDETTYSYQYWGGTFAFLVCNTCGNVLVKDWHSNYRSMKPPRFCDNCGRHVGKRVKVDEAKAIRLAKMMMERSRKD